MTRENIQLLFCVLKEVKEQLGFELEMIQLTTAVDDCLDIIGALNEQ